MSISHTLFVSRRTSLDHCAAAALAATACLIVSAGIVQAADFALIDESGAPVSLEGYRQDGRWTLVLIRPEGCDTCDRAERELHQWHMRQEPSEVSALVIHMNGEPIAAAGAERSGAGHDVAFSRDPDTTSEGFSELAGKALTALPTWMFFAPPGLFIDSETGAELDTRTLDEMIAADFGNAPARVPADTASTMEATSAGDPPADRSAEPSDYERDVDAVMIEIGYVGRAMIDIVGVDDRVVDPWAFKRELEDLLEGGDLDGFRAALTSRELIVTPNPIMGMLLSVHPYQPRDAGYAIGEAILDGDLEELTELLATTDADLDASVYVRDRLGFTPLVLAAQERSLPMVEALLAAGARPDAASGDQVSVTPMDVANAMNDETLAAVLRDAGAN